MMPIPGYPASFTFVSDEVSQDPAVVARFARRHGFRGIELRSMFGRQFRDLSGSDVAEIRRVLGDHGLSVHGCATPVFKCARGDAAQLREHRELFRRSVDVAHALGCTLLRVFTFLRESTPGTAPAIAEAAAQVAALRELAGTMLIGVENEASCIVGTPEECVQLLRYLPETGFGLIWDPCNVLYVPSHAGAATAGFAALAHRVIHIHAKDAARTPAGVEARKMGDGEVGWHAHFADLAHRGYRGLISLETHWRKTALAGDALHLPGGQAFSLGGEAASEECLEAIRHLLPGQGAV